MVPKPRRNPLIWIGPLVAFAGVVSYFEVFARFPALRDVPWVNLPLTALGLALSGAGLQRAWRSAVRVRTKVLAAIGFGFSLLLAAALIWYVFSWSYQMPSTGKARNLAEAPDFALAASTGETVRLSDYRGRKVVLVFYRGFW